MTSAFPDSPRLVKGALAIYPGGRPGTQAQVVVFQYNPDVMRRTLADSAPPQERQAGAPVRADAMRIRGPPKETINLSVVLDAADQLEQPAQNPTVKDKGLLPALFLLETLLYPTADQARENERLASQGEVQTRTPEMPAVLVVWGEHRAAPVRLTGLTINEEAFDHRLNPIRAKLELSMQVLTTEDVPDNRVEWRAFSAYMQQKQSLAQRHEAREGEEAIGGPLPV